MSVINYGQRTRWPAKSEGTVVGFVRALDNVKRRLSKEQKARVCHAVDPIRGFRRAIIEDKLGRLHIVACGRLEALPKLTAPTS